MSICAQGIERTESRRGQKTATTTNQSPHDIVFIVTTLKYHRIGAGEMISGS